MIDFFMKILCNNSGVKSTDFFLNVMIIFARNEAISLTIDSASAVASFLAMTYFGVTLTKKHKKTWQYKLPGS
ncbi:hypothetical protein ASD98_07930 [Flavobacterium sp. Root186]|nr:hypothetical protein ASD98_07930 [Flavobacterium sp. Root186]